MVLVAALSDRAAEFHVESIQYPVLLHNAFLSGWPLFLRLPKNIARPGRGVYVYHYEKKYVTLPENTPPHAPFDGLRRETDPQFLYFPLRRVYGFGLQ
jgi:hypothetical protein